MLLNLALKNIIRYKRRTILTLLLIIFSIGAYVWMDGFARGVREKSYENVINFETAHIQIRTRDYNEKKPFSKINYILGYQRILEKIKRKDFITGSTIRIRSTGEIDNGIDSAPVEAWGIDPLSDASVFNLKEFIIKGNLRSGGTVIGKTLADDLGIGMGDFIYFTTRTLDGMLDSIELEVTGLVESADPVVNNSTLYLTVEDMKDYLGVEGVTQIAIKTDSLRKVKIYKEKIQELCEGLDVQDWTQLGESYIKFAETDWNYGKLFIYLILFLAFVGISNTMLMSVFEKKKEIGTLKALGMTDLQVQGMFILEGFWLGIIGCIIGMIVGGLLNSYFVTHGLDMTKMLGQDEGFGGYKVAGIVYAKWSYIPYISSVFLSLLASVGASLVAARQTTKMHPAECLRTKQ